jgi:hypothetical protein
MKTFKKTDQRLHYPKPSHPPGETAWHHSDFAWEFDWPSSTEPLPAILPSTLDKALALAG